MSTLRCVGWPSSSTLSEPRRLCDGAVVDHRAQLAGHLLADAAAEGRDALAVEIGFEAVPHGFMQQDARPARPQHHGHLAGRRFDGVQHGDGFARGLGGRSAPAACP